MFDPTQPATSSALSSAVMRSQLTSLKALIDALVSVTGAQVDDTATLDPGNPATAAVTVDGNTLRFTFGIPRGSDGSDGQEGQTGPEGQQGIQGQPGEVSSAQLDAALGTTSSNSNGVATLTMAPNDPPTAYDVQQITDKLNELITALRR